LAKKDSRALGVAIGAEADGPTDEPEGPEVVEIKTPPDAFSLSMSHCRRSTADKTLNVRPLRQDLTLSSELHFSGADRSYF
jgi:hypothetical protein